MSIEHVVARQHLYLTRFHEQPSEMELSIQDVCSRYTDSLDIMTSLPGPFVAHMKVGTIRNKTVNSMWLHTVETI